MTKRSKVEAYRWRSAKRSVMIKLIGLINGKLLTPSKHSQLIKVSSFLNIKPVIDNSLNKDSSWFAGFFDAYGCVSTSTGGDAPSVIFLFEIRIL